MPQAQLTLLPPIDLSTLPSTHTVSCVHFDGLPKPNVALDFKMLVAVDTVSVTLWPNESVLIDGFRHQGYFGACPNCGHEYQCVITAPN